MSLKRPFHCQIAAEPENLLHRLIYADWLEEQGDPAAELLRIQERLRNSDVPDRPQLEQRMRELLARGVKPLRITCTSSIGLKLVLIFPGSFQMGSPATEPERNAAAEGPVAVTLTQGYWIGRFQVTQAQFQQVTGYNPSGWTPAIVRDDTAQHPAENMTWEQALGFCDRLTELDRQAGLLPHPWVYALPSEAQWEYACRAGTSTATAFGNYLTSDLANFYGTQPYQRQQPQHFVRHTTPVGSYPPNAWGLYDMHGNVCDWCRDWYHVSPTGGTDPENQEPSQSRVLRGGGWNSYGSYCRSALRAWGIVPHRNDFGFRVILQRLR